MCLLRRAANPETLKGKEITGRVPFFAAGISSVMHPKNPHAPTMHFNYRQAQAYPTFARSFALSLHSPCASSQPPAQLSLQRSSHSRGLQQWAQRIVFIAVWRALVGGA